MSRARALRRAKAARKRLKNKKRTKAPNKIKRNRKSQRRRKSKLISRRKRARMLARRRKSRAAKPSASIAPTGSATPVTAPVKNAEVSNDSNNKPEPLLYSDYVKQKNDMISKHRYEPDQKQREFSRRTGDYRKTTWLNSSEYKNLQNQYSQEKDDLVTKYQKTIYDEWSKRKTDGNNYNVDHLNQHVFHHKAYNARNQAWNQEEFDPNKGSSSLEAINASNAFNAKYPNVSTSSRFIPSYSQRQARRNALPSNNPRYRPWTGRI